MFKQLIVAICALMLFPLSAQADLDAYSDGFDGPTLDPSWNTQGSAGAHIGFNGTGQYCMTDENGFADPTKLSRNIDDDGTPGDFTADVTFTPTTFLGTNSDVKWKWFGPDGFTEIVWNSFDNLRIFQGGVGNVVTDFNTGFVDGDTIQFKISYSGGDTLSVDYALNGGALVNIYTGTGFGDVFTNFTEFEMNQFNVNGTGSPTIKFDILNINQPTTGALCGDVDLDGMVTFLDIQPFIALLSSNGFQAEADCNMDAAVTFLDIAPFIAALAGP